MSLSTHGNLKALVGEDECRVGSREVGVRLKQREKIMSVPSSMSRRANA